MSADPRRCFKCQKSIPGKATYALGKLWHCECFTCTYCGREIHNEFQEKEGQAYCIDCYATKFNPKCSACGVLLRETCIKAMESTWHQTCFVCCECSKPFDDGQFYVVDGKQYCLDDHWGKRLEKLQAEAGAGAEASKPAADAKPAADPKPDAPATDLTPSDVPATAETPTDTGSPAETAVEKKDGEADKPAEDSSKPAADSSPLIPSAAEDKPYEKVGKAAEETKADDPEKAAEAKTDEAKPEEAKPEEAKPDETKPEDSKDAKPEDPKPEDPKPEDAKAADDSKPKKEDAVNVNVTVNVSDMPPCL